MNKQYKTSRNESIYWCYCNEINFTMPPRFHPKGWSFMNITGTNHWYLTLDKKYNDNRKNDIHANDILIYMHYLKREKL